jgi:hypothetical protein
VRRTRYRSLSWKSTDWVVLGGAIVSALAILLVKPEAVRYEPYPTLDAPVASVPLAVGLLGLLGPAVVLLWLERTRT